jgi:hypothetical protein
MLGVGLGLFRGHPDCHINVLGSLSQTNWVREASRLFVVSEVAIT